MRKILAPEFCKFLEKHMEQSRENYDSIQFLYHGEKLWFNAVIQNGRAFVCFPERQTILILDKGEYEID